MTRIQDGERRDIVTHNTWSLEGSTCYKVRLGKGQKGGLCSGGENTSGGMEKLTVGGWQWKEAWDAKLPR